MPTAAIELFYSYAHEDETLRTQLNTHLALLQQQELIRPWHDRDISAGTLWDKEINAHLRSARIILLLISPDFIASDYCYSVEMQEAIKRHVAGEARVIPIILRPCDWEAAPFGKIQASPKDGKPVTTWSNRDQAFTDIAKGIRKIVEEMVGARSADTAQAPETRKKSGKQGPQVEGNEGRRMAITPTTISPPIIKKAVERYHKELAYYAEQATDELGLRAAFQNLLADVARHVNWKVSPERTMEGNIRPDGVLRDEFDLRRGFWEAKGPKGNLDKEIEKKIADGYPLTNTVFENTARAVLYQNKRRVGEYDLTDPKGVGDLLQRFLTYTEPDIENFEVAVGEFKERIPELAKALLSIIEKEQKQNKKFITAFDTFTALCRNALNPQISTDAIKEMLVQHLLTERLFRTIFNNPDFVHRNAIAAEIETVIQALTSRSFNRQDFLQSLDRFYIAIERAATGIENWSERQHFLNTVYERFFQGFSIKQADTLGIVYTPQEIVDFMCASVEEVLKSEFGTSIAEPGVKILDPATGTGSFIVNLVHRIPSYRLKQKYLNDLFCNEIALLPYYIASLNIEHEYYARMGEYEPFEGICFVDTLTLAEGKQLAFDMFTEENTTRVKTEKDAQIMVVIGNPPYNVGQLNENDNNKNRKYPVIDQRIRETYAKDSKASNKNALSDAYVKFFRWATDRLNGRDGIVCLVTNNSFVDQIAFDGMRMHLQKDFTQIYHIDFHGNVRKNPKLSGTTHNVFGIQVGVGVTIAVRSSHSKDRFIKYYRVPEFWRKTDKLAFLKEKENISRIDWLELQPDERHSWLIEGLHSEFATFLPIGSKDGKATRIGGVEVQAIFKNYSQGVQTGRDNWMYDFDGEKLAVKARSMIEIYNAELSRWLRAGSPKDIDNFVINDERKIKWSSRLKECFSRKVETSFEALSIRKSLYRPFTRQFLYFDHIMTHRQGMLPIIFPTFLSENVGICVTGIGANHQTFLAVDSIVDVKFGISGNSTIQYFPFYIYDKNGTNRRENITDWALKQFQAKYGEQITKWDIFHYVYAMLHHPQYRERYAENLKRDLPHIPLLHDREQFEVCVRIGKELMDLHLNYEQAREYDLDWQENEEVRFDWRVEKMRLTPDKTALLVNDGLTLAGIPHECFEYRLGNRSALEWVIDQYQVSEDKRSGIKSDPNNLEDEEYIIRLVGRVVTVSVETVRLVNELATAVQAEDWLDEAP